MADMNGKTVVVTGATNGIGEAIALALAKMGAETILVSRSEQKCQDTAARIREETGNENVRYYVADLSSQAQVHDVAAQLRRDLTRLDVLVNNAGAWFTDYKESADGIEMTWALNHMNYFILTNDLLDLIKQTAAEHGDARIINQSSSAHHAGEIHWDNIGFKGVWDTEGRGSSGPGWAVYSQSKYANVLFSFALARRLEGTNITVNAVHPGVVVTGFSQNNGLLYQIAAPIRKLFNRSTPMEGAEPAVWLASAPEAATITGKYYGPPHKEETPKASARDTAEQDRLWQLSEAMMTAPQPS
jgi:NAD(P)-dependent dehydrogenase (short-subunit alcohol dehydrogenase family)